MVADNDDEDDLYTSCENCGESVPLDDTWTCRRCLNGPLCPECICDDCPIGSGEECDEEE